jgi:hypothetical protein
MKKNVPGHSGNHEQLIFGIGDYHDKYHPANQSQRVYLESMIKKYRNSKVIVEDLGSVNNDGKGMCCNFMMHVGKGVLSALADAARLASVDVDNIEYRYCRVAALGPLLNNLHVDPSAIHSASSIPLSMIEQETADELDKIQKYNDGNLLNGMYKAAARHIKKIFGQLKFDRFSEKSVAEYCSRWPKNQYRDNLEKLCIFDSILLDMKIIHSIIIAPDKSVIIIVAGGSHIEKTKHLLTRLGYKEVMGFSGVFSDHVETALGSEKKDSSTTKCPGALDMRILDQYTSLVK